MNNEENNSLGLAGFVVALVGFLTCGFISPIGLILSLLGLAGRPRGLAIAGTVFGLLGSLWLFFVGFAMVTAMLGFGAAVKATGDAIEIAHKKNMAEFEKHQSDQKKLIADANKRIAENQRSSPIVQKTKTIESKPPESPVANEIQIDKPKVPVPPENKNDLLPVANNAPAIVRNWKSSTGSFDVMAELIFFKNETVKLKRIDNGKEIELPENKLSIDDRNWLRKLRARGGFDSDGKPIPYHAKLVD